MLTLVTGATGLVGSHLVDELLARGQQVRALVRDSAKETALRKRGVEVVVGDVRYPNVFPPALRGVTTVQHCAAAVGNHCTKKEIYETNLEGVRNLLAACRGTSKRVVLVSSINVLGTRNLDPATEELPWLPSRDPAADVKIAAERLALEFARQGGDLTIVRPGFIYGPGDRHNLPRLVAAIGRGKFMFLGKRDNVVPIVHVEDVVQALLLAAATPAARGRVYHVTDGTRTTIGELADFLAELLGCAAPRRVLPYRLASLACWFFEWRRRLRPGKGPGPITRAGLRFLGTSRFVDIRRAREELGYEPRHSFRSGMAATLPWINTHLEAAHVNSRVH